MQGDMQGAYSWGLTVQADDFSHGEGNVHLIWLCLVVIVLMDKRRASWSGVRLECGSGLSSEEDLCGCCCFLEKARTKRSTALTAQGWACGRSIKAYQPRGTQNVLRSPVDYKKFR